MIYIIEDIRSEFKVNFTENFEVKEISNFLDIENKTPIIEFNNIKRTTQKNISSSKQKNKKPSNKFNHDKIFSELIIKENAYLQTADTIQTKNSIPTNPFIKILTNIITPIKKKIIKPINKIKEKFTFEFGVGFGYGKSSSINIKKINFETSSSIYNDFNFGIENGKKYNSTTSSAGISSGPFEFGGTITHLDDNRVTEDGLLHDNVMLIPWVLLDCPNTTKDFSFGLKKDDIKANSTSLDTKDLFIGLEFEIHLIVGGHVKIGFTDLKLTDLKL